MCRAPVVDIVQTFDVQAFEAGDEANSGRERERWPTMSSTTMPGRTTTRRPDLRLVPAARPDRATGLRLTRRGRMVVTVIAVGLALAAGSAAQRAAADTPGEAVQVTAHTVTTGETLWRVASSITEPGEDVRVAVDLLMDLNGLASSSLQVGQQLLIPAS